MDFPKAYNPKQVEERIYRLWEKSGFFNPDVCVKKGVTKKTAKPFSIVLPPPNVTGVLHMGHAAMLVIEDVLIRYHRMKGHQTLWLPGTDHASIATETKFLKEKKIARSDYREKRDEFIKLVNDFALQNQGAIIKQLRAMGASLDWSRLAYTLDAKRRNAVQEAFIRMHRSGLIYMGKGQPINWDFKGQTVVSDDEIEYEPGKATLYTFRYSKDFPIAISSTRPETKVGDTAIAVHPRDKRYKNYIGKTFHIAFAKIKLSIKIVGDPSVDPKFGTGAVGVTPAHSKIDYEIASRHNLPSRQVINEFDRMNDDAGPLIAGKKTGEAREIVVDYLKKQGLLEKEEVIDQNIPKAQRSGGIIEILPKRHQFFVNVNKPLPERGNKTLKKLMRDVVTTGKIKILPKRFEKVYLNWIDNLRDWSISRQIWYGHRLPVWYKPPAPAGYDLDYVVSKTRPAGEGWEQFSDTLDTWFSSGLWTFSTLGWPDPKEQKRQNFKLYHPTSVLETGYDILFFWVARMILMSNALLGQVPFRVVYLHGLVRDSKGKKMSKSLGNIIDPLVMIEKYGADATRLSLIIGAAPGNDMKLSEDKVRGYRNFSNKLWNIARFIHMNTQDYTHKTKPVLSAEDKKILADFKKIKKRATDLIVQYRFSQAAETLYHYAWHTFADKILEESKDTLQPHKTRAARQYVLLTVLTDLLRLLHPFIPFITEEIYQKLLIKKKKNCLMVEAWPL